MKLEKLEGVTKTLAAQLKTDGWTVSEIATARPANLRKYKGVGLATAKKIIKAAQDVVNEEALEEAAKLDPPIIQPEAEAPLEPAISVRLRRLRELNKNNE